MRGMPASVRANALNRLIQDEADRIMEAFTDNVNSRHRATTKVTKRILIKGPYTIDDKNYDIKAKSLGTGIYELRAELTYR